MLTNLCPKPSGPSMAISHSSYRLSLILERYWRSSGLQDCRPIHHWPRPLSVLHSRACIQPPWGRWRRAASNGWGAIPAHRLGIGRLPSPPFFGGGLLHVILSLLMRRLLNVCQLRQGRNVKIRSGCRYQTSRSTSVSSVKPWSGAMEAVDY